MERLFRSLKSEWIPVITGTQFALFTSFMAFGRTLLSASSGWVVEMMGWFDFFLVSTIVALPGLLLLVWMMKYLPLSAEIRR